MAMKRNQYVVFGLGRFGVSLTKALNDYGAEVLCVDTDEDKINEISPFCTHAVCMDATDENNLKRLGINNMDVAIVCIASKVEASIFITLLCKQMGIPVVISKASDERHKLVLERVGADSVIIPEEAMGERLAAMLAKPNVVEVMTLADRFRIVEIHTPKRWQDRSLLELNLRNTEHVNIIVIKRGDDILTSPAPEEKLLADDLLVVAGAIEDINRLSSKASGKAVTDLIGKL